MKNGKHIGSIRTLVELLDCQLRRVEKELECSLVMAVNQSNYCRYKYRVTVDDCEIRRFESKKNLSKAEIRKERLHWSKVFNLDSIRGIDVVRYAI